MLGGGAGILGSGAGMLDGGAGILGSGDGAGILKHVLGGKQNEVAAGVGRAVGLDGAQAAKLLAMLAPMVMAALGSAKRSKGLDAGGLTTMLGEERTAIGAQSGGGLGSLLQLIDADKDGSVMDDVGGMLGRMFGR